MAELAYDERTTNFVTTNAERLDPTTVIDGLDVTVVGTGAAVEVEFYCPAIGNSGSLVATTWFVVNGAVPATSQWRNWPASTGGTGGSMTRRFVLTNAVSYTFQVGLSATAASATTTAYGTLTPKGGGTATGAMYLRVTG